MRLAAVALLVGAGCVGKGAFTCQTDTQCGTGGRCEPSTSSCSFVDSTCGSGRRYGTYSPSSIANACVAPLADGGVPSDDGPIATFDAAPPGTPDARPRPDAARPVDAHVGPDAVKPDAAPANCVMDLGAGREETWVVRTDGKVYGWGNNGYNQLDYDSQNAGPHATHMNLPSPVAEVRPGWSTGCVLGADKSVWCVGDNTDGEVGDGTTSSPFGTATQTLTQRTPTQIGLVADDLSLGYYHGCALSNGVAYCWGMEHQDQAGTLVPLDGGFEPPTLLATPLASQPPMPTAISAGGTHTCTIDGADGSVWCWGSDGSGELGDGGHTKTAVPVQATAAGTGVVQLASGGQNTCARSSSGQLACWGDDSSSQTSKASTITDATDVAVGDTFVCAIRAGGEVWCWGSNTFGHLAQPIATKMLAMPTDTGFGDAAKIVAGDDFACALTNGHEVWCWGLNEDDEIGQPDAVTESTVPVIVPVPCP